MPAAAKLRAGPRRETGCAGIEVERHLLLAAGDGVQTKNSVACRAPAMEAGEKIDGTPCMRFGAVHGREPPVVTSKALVPQLVGCTAAAQQVKTPQCDASNVFAHSLLQTSRQPRHILTTHIQDLRGLRASGDGERLKLPDDRHRAKDCARQENNELPHHIRGTFRHGQRACVPIGSRQRINTGSLHKTSQNDVDCLLGNHALTEEAVPPRSRLLAEEI
eukprot:CAMPEP_0172944070 /NCGR_PEP_ID=MMETSP1075-20121228/225864_1 /TAXON_ID=2916 /ORGANISM="Ceratium fusus, Strain PA161109" /LENGTH=218 /DNA_ID=CAMNT_0013805497 /DNA_START=28 /DNA_END=683 /DNA_ORIENTATION=-